MVLEFLVMAMSLIALASLLHDRLRSLVSSIVLPDWNDFLAVIIVSTVVLRKCDFLSLFWGDNSKSLSCVDTFDSLHDLFTIF